MLGLADLAWAGAGVRVRARVGVRVKVRLRARVRVRVRVMVGARVRLRVGSISSPFSKATKDSWHLIAKSSLTEPRSKRSCSRARSVARGWKPHKRRSALTAAP